MLTHYEFLVKKMPIDLFNYNKQAIGMVLQAYYFIYHAIVKLNPMDFHVPPSI